MLTTATAPSSTPTWYENEAYHAPDSLDIHRYLRRVVKYHDGVPIILEKGITHEPTLDFSASDDKELNWVWEGITEGYLKDRNGLQITKARIRYVS